MQDMELTTFVQLISQPILQALMLIPSQDEIASMPMDQLCTSYVFPSEYQYILPRHSNRSYSEALCDTQLCCNYPILSLIPGLPCFSLFSFC